MSNPNPINESGGFKRSALKDLVVSLIINVGIPLLIIYLLMTYLHVSELLALSVASVIPILASILELVRNRRLDLLAIIFLLGVLSSIVAILVGGDAHLLIIRESFFTAALGLFCFVSLLFLPRPLMFYVGRQMMVGNDPERLKQYNEGWNDPRARSVHRRITTVWGCALLGEFIVRVIIALTLPVITAYAVGSTIFILTLAGTFVWTFAYVRYVTRRAQAAQQQNESLS